MTVRECYCVKLSPSKKSIYGLRMRQILLVLVFTSIMISSCVADLELSCTNVRNIFEKKGMLSVVDIQEQPNSDADGLCGMQGCCGAAARAPLTQQARRQLEDALRSELGKLADVLGNRAKRFDDFFRKLLQISREGFHAMFKRTYGMIYEQHSYVFEQLFEQLERYYTLGDTNFEHMMDHFFGILYQKMFSVLNAQYSFDEKYLKCVNEHMRDIQPFEDVPHKLSVQLRRAFVATRTFHKALRAGADVVRNMMQVGVGEECAAAWARLRWCGACGAVAAPACSRYCHNVLRGCLPAHADLADNWDAYVDAVEKVADRLLGPFNIAMVVEPIDIKISEAIMSFQEHNQEISQKIFAGCGKPVLGGGGGSGAFFAPERSRRSPRALPPPARLRPAANDVDDFEIEASFESLVNDDPSLLSLRTPEGIKKITDEMAEHAKSRERFLQYMRGNIDLEAYEEHERRKRDAEPEPAGGAEIDFRSYEFAGKRGSKKKKPAAKAEDGHGSEWAGPALEKLVRETRLRVRATHHYWSHLPALLCSPASVTSAPCFNGTHSASYTLSSAGEGSEALAANPEVRGATRAPAAVARAQLDALPALTARLKDAYNGVEVQWKDDSDSLAAAESQMHSLTEPGSGSGSGDDADDEDGRDRLPDDDEDRDPPTDYPEGSGEGPRRDDEDSLETEVEEPSGTERPALPGPPGLPGVVDSPKSNNVQVRGHVGAAPPPPEPPAPPAAGAAGAPARPSLQKALFTYALPVVCAWFGTIITDLI
ncbi:glypican-6 [Cydia splendana]|uniref:glypican-6 n=1 Tax=Cydia splendana TaxID=1100963 RepID=UPI002126C767